MRNLIVLIFLCLFLTNINAQSSNITTSLSDEIDYDFNTDPKWPDCIAPNIVIEISNYDEDSHIHIDNYNEEMHYYFMLIESSTDDTTYYEHNINLLPLNSDIFSYEVYARVECNENISSDWNRVKLKNIVNDSRDPTCFSKTIHSYNSIENGFLFLTFANDSGNHNDVFEGKLGSHIKFEVDWLNSNDQVVLNQKYFSNVTLGAIGVSPTNEDPYFFKFPSPDGLILGEVRVTTGITNDCLIFYETSSCSSSNHTCSIGATIAGLVDDNNIPDNFIDLSEYFCGQENIDYSSICSYTSFIEGEINNNDLVLSFNTVTQAEFQQQISETQISKIDLSITGISATGESSTIIPFWNENSSNFNISNWQEYLSGYGAFTTFIVTLKVYNELGHIVPCNTFSNIPVTVDSKICDILGLLNIHPVNETTVKFDFIDEENPNHLSEGLTSIGYTQSEAEAFIMSKINYIDFNLSYSNGQQYLNSSKSVNIGDELDLTNFNVEMTVNSLENFSGALQLEFMFPNGSLKNCLLSPLNIITEDDEDESNTLPTLDCNDIPPDLTGMSPELKIDPIKVGDVVKINGFPLIITKLSSPNQPINGEGVIPMPFKNKQLFVDLNNIGVNINNQVISGEAIGKNGPGITAFPNFNLPPVYIGGDICVPPPVTGNVDANGIDSATGLTGYGFDTQTGLHFNGTPYDYNGFDINGNHKNTGKPYNNDLCSRDGYLYQPNENGDTVITNIECDPTGGNADPVQLDSFINMIKVSIEDSIAITYELKLSEYRQEYDEALALCATLESDIQDPSKSIIHDLIQGANNQYVYNPSSNFTHKPEPLLINGARKPKFLETEILHGELYDCHQNATKFRQVWSVFGSINLNEFRDFILEELESISQAELEGIMSPNGLKPWILNKIYEFHKSKGEDFDFGYIEDHNSVDFDTYNDSPYFSTASLSEIPNSNSDEYLNAMNFEYNQGFEKILGYDRAVVTESIRKAQLAMGDPTISNFLPLNIDTSFSKFDLSILISSVIFHPTTASMDVAAVLTNKKNGQKIAFGASSIPLEAGALNNESTKLFLLNDVGIRLNNASRLFLKSDLGQTFIEWDCNGFSSIGLNGSIQFCREYVLPLDNDFEVIEDELYEVFFTNEISSSLDFYFNVEAPPFELTTMRGFKWQIDNLGVDFTSNKIDGLNLNVPKGYNSPYFDGTNLDDLWEGFYAQNVTVQLPKKLFGNATISASDILIDDTGFTGLIEKDLEILSYEEGNANGWQLSVESINILILQNSLAGGGFGGRIGVPVVEQPLAYTATVYKDNYLFSVKPSTDSLTFSPLGMNLELKKNSYLQATYSEEIGFEAKAHLNGSISPKEGSSLASKVKLPTFKFEKLEVQSYIEGGENKLRFSPGYWGVVREKDSSGELQPLFSGFGLTINELGVYGNEENDGLFLAVDADLELIENSLTGGGGFEIHGKFDESSPVFKMKYDKFKVKSVNVDGSIKGTLSVKGYLEWFDPQPLAEVDYGQGFRGMVDSKFETLLGGFGLTAAAQFGNVNDNKYHFVDIVSELPNGINLAGLSINKIGGGYMKGLMPDYSTIKPQADFLSFDEFINSPLGTTLSGIQYTPSLDERKEFKLLAGFHLAKEDIFNGIGEFIVKLSPSNSLDEIEIRAQGQFLKAPDPYSLTDVASLGLPVNLSGQDSTLIQNSLMPKPNIPSNPALSGYAGFRYNFKKKEFSGKIAAYLNMPGGIIKGAGENGALCIVDIYFGKNDWWIWVGEPTPGKRAGLLVDLAILEAGLQGYFDIGTKIPPFPGLPSRVRHLGQELNINESSRTSEFAFAFGASFDFLFDASFAGSGIEVGVGAGFDVMLRKYDELLCLDDETGEVSDLGIDGWYAMGQAWAYLDGSIKIIGIKVASLGVAAVLQVQAPNPTWALAALEVKYGDDPEQTWTGEIEIGSRCNFTNEDPDDGFGMNVIVNIDPTQNQIDVGLDQDIKVDFLFPLNDTIAEYQFLDGEDPGMLTFELDWQNIKVESNKGILDFEYLMDKKLNNLIIRPLNFLFPEDSVFVNIKVDIYKNGNYFDSQVKNISFKTAPGLDIIPLNNIEYQYPVRGMINFHKNQYIKREGYIKLIKGQSNLFHSHLTDEYGNEKQYDVVAKFTSEYGDVHEEAVSYGKELFNNEVTFLMDPDKFQNGVKYKLEIVRKFSTTADILLEGTELKTAATSSKNQDRIYYTSFFRTSQYSKIEDKLAEAMNNISGSGKKEAKKRGPTDKEDIFLYYKTLQNTNESFDYFDLLGNGTGIPLVTFKGYRKKEVINDDFDLFLFNGANSWPAVSNFTEFIGYGTAFISSTSVALDNDYSINENNFNSSSFEVRTDPLTLGFATNNGSRFSRDPDGHIKIFYNFPGKESFPILDSWKSDFFDNYYFGTYTGNILDSNPAILAHRTQEVINIIFNTQ